MNEFENWLVENYGFEANGAVIKNKPPMFVRSDGFFDVVAYEKWKERKMAEFNSKEEKWKTV
jgi:hypothetical protein